MIVKSTSEVWTVQETMVGPFELTPFVWDNVAGVERRTESQPVVLECSHPSKPGSVFEVHGVRSTERRQSGNGLERDPWRFEMGNTITIRFDRIDSEAVSAAGVAPLHRAVKRYYEDMARDLPEFWGMARSLPAPGQKGHNDGHYALWAKRYLDAVDAHGRGYLAKLIEAYPYDITKSNLMRTVNRAADLGLCVIERAPGRVSSGYMTPEGLALLKKAGLA